MKERYSRVTSNARAEPPPRIAASREPSAREARLRRSARAPGWASTFLPQNYESRHYEVYQKHAAE
jgi:hypothetical protein